MSVCNRLGLVVSVDYGKGSHCAVYKNGTILPPTSESLVVTLVHNYYPEIQKKTARKIIFNGLKTGDYSESDFWDSAERQ